MKELNENQNLQEFFIRPFLEQDRDIIQDFWLELDLHISSQFTDADRFRKNSHYPDYVNKCLSQYQRNNDSLLLVGESQDVVSGFIVAHKQSLEWYKEKSVGLIGACFVHSLYRRRGLARQLVEQVQAWFRQQQINYVDVVWDDCNKQAEKFWVALGFKPSQIRAHKKLI